MKWIRTIFVIVSIILSLLILYAITNIMVSHKYEIEGRAGDLVDIQWVEEWMFSNVEHLMVFLGYVVVNIIILSISMCRKKSDPK